MKRSKAVGITDHGTFIQLVAYKNSDETHEEEPDKVISCILEK
jgi:hypothetical protein